MREVEVESGRATSLVAVVEDEVEVEERSPFGAEIVERMRSVKECKLLYRNLIVWQKAMQFTRLVYSVARDFPPEEKYALSDQLRRAVVSVASNIAEGCGRASNKDYAHFLAISRGSLYETMTQLELAQSLGYIDSLEALEPLAIEISRILGSLLKKYGGLKND